MPLYNNIVDLSLNKIDSYCINDKKYVTRGYVKLYSITLYLVQFAVIALNPARVLHNMQYAYRNAVNEKSVCHLTAVKAFCRRSYNSVCSILSRHFRVVRSENSFDIWPSTVQNDY